jgi:hypothetical protein
MDVSKFLGQVVSAIRKSDERPDKVKTDKKENDGPPKPVSPSPQPRTNERSLKAETTQDFRQIVSQFDFGLPLKDGGIEAQPKKESIDPKIGDKSPLFEEKSKAKINLINVGMAKNSSKPEDLGVKKAEIEAEALKKPPENGIASVKAPIKIRPLLPMPVRKPNAVDMLDQKRKDEIEAEYLKKLDDQYGLKLKAVTNQKLGEEEIYEPDEEEIEKQLREDAKGTATNYKQFNMGNFYSAQNAIQPGYQKAFNAPASNSSVDSFQGFSSGAGKPVQLDEEILKRAKAMMADLGFEEEIQNFENTNQNGNTGFVNPFQSANQNFNTSSNPFSAPPAFQNHKQEEQHKFFNKPFMKEGPSDTGFAKPNENTGGAISFTTGNMNSMVNINPDNLKRALALFADDDEEDDQPPSPQINDENARMGPPQVKGQKSPPKNPQQPLPTKFMVTNKPPLNGAAQKKVIVVEQEKEVEEVEKPPNHNPDEYSLRAALNKTSKDSVPAQNLQKQAKNPFSVEPKKVVKKAFEVPHRDKSTIAPKLNFGITKPAMVRVKTALSKFHNVVNIDNDRYTRMTSNLKKRTKLQGYKEKRVSKNYGWIFLTMGEIYEHLKPELDDLDIKGVDEFLDQLVIELRHQLNKPDIDLGWVEHHLKMLSRKYYNRVKNEGASSSSFLPKTATIIPYKVDTRNILTDLYYRYRREEFFQRLSVIRLMNEGQFQADQRVCLMVVSITNSKDKYQIELTDGWYLVYMELYTSQEKESALRDINDCYLEFNNNLILRLILKGHLKPGQKVEASNLKIERTENQPIYKPTKVELQYNSLRKMAWNTQMGLLYTRIKPTKLKDVKPSGGIVPMIDVLILEKRGVKISNPERDEFMIKMQHGDNERLSINFSLIVIDSLHIDPAYQAPITLHMVTFRSSDPGKYLDVSVGQRLQIYGVKMRKSKQYTVNQANFVTQLPWGLHFSENRRNSSNPLEIPLKLRSEHYSKLLDLRRKEFVSLEDMKDALLRVMNMPKMEAGDFLLSSAVKYVKHSGNLALFHLYEKHFIQVEIRAGQGGKPGSSKDEGKGGQPQTPFWERVMRDLCAISESNCELLLFYDLNYGGFSKTVELKSRGKIYIHKFSFDVINDYMLGENFVITNIENNSIERFLINEYKKHKNMKIGDNDSLAQLLCDMSKYPLA